MNESDNRTLAGTNAVVTGGTGVLGSRMVETLVAAGARVVTLGRNEERGEAAARRARETGGDALFVQCDLLDAASVREARERVRNELGPIHLLVNAAGGNAPEATVDDANPFFEADLDAIDRVMRVNFTSAVAGCQAFARDMAEAGRGSIINIASMASYHPMTRVLAYAAAKAAIVNFTEWLAVHMAQTYGPGIRVNAIAPGFFLTEQNRYLLTDEQGGPTPRGESITRNTPMGRYGAPEELDSALLFLADPRSTFVTGIVVPVDGGFLAYSGV